MKRFCFISINFHFHSSNYNCCSLDNSLTDSLTQPRFAGYSQSFVTHRLSSHSAPSSITAVILSIFKQRRMLWTSCTAGNVQVLDSVTCLTWMPADCIFSVPFFFLWSLKQIHDMFNRTLYSAGLPGRSVSSAWSSVQLCETWFQSPSSLQPIMYQLQSR